MANYTVTLYSIKYRYGEAGHRVLQTKITAAFMFVFCHQSVKILLLLKESHI